MRDIQTHRVILVGSDPKRASALRSIFNQIPNEAYEVDWVPDARRLEKETSESSHEVCVLDVSPGVNWREFLMQRAQGDSCVPVVLLTDHEDRDFDHEAMKLGAADSAVRDRLTPFALERIIRHALHRRKAAMEVRSRDAELLIQERLAAVGMLASGMAHEIGTPLGVIRGRAEVVLMRGGISEAAQRDLRIIIEQADRIAKLMKSLMNLARGDDIRSSQSINLGAVIDDVLSMMTGVLEMEGIQVLKEMPDTAQLRVHAESEPFHQILLNLIQNALHAIEEAKEQGRSEGHFIKISVADSDEKWILKVEDSGCGMTPEVIRGLFRPFFTTKGIGQGMGLGLSLSHRILESWRASISVESAPGVGSKFTILVPKA